MTLPGEEKHSNPENCMADLDFMRRNYIGLGAFISTATTNLSYGPLWLNDWRELISISTSSGIQSHYLTGELRLEATIEKLLLGGRIKIFARIVNDVAIHRFYVRATDAISQQPESSSGEYGAPRNIHGDQIERILPYLNTSQDVWMGAMANDGESFDPWASTEDGSLFYIFNTIPSPSPDPNAVKDLTVREAMEDLLDYSTPLPGLKTQLYPYQARSAAQMIQHESCITGRVDPRFESRLDMDGYTYYYSPRNMIFRKSAPIYDSTRGGILAESMGLGKTIICLALILATKHHLPRIPAFYEISPLPDDEVPSLMHTAQRSAWKHSIAVRPLLERLERIRGTHYTLCLENWDNHPPEYMVPGKPPRSLRKVKIPPPRKMTVCKGTIIVVPRNLVHQWKAELRKHINPGTNGLNILFMDDPNASMPPVEELQSYDILLFSKARFEKEANDGVQAWHRREIVLGANYQPINQDVPYLPEIYKSPLKDLHFLRIIIDEGHEFSSSNSNAVLVAEKVVTAERRWVVSGTPARDKLYGLDVDLAGAAEIDDIDDFDDDDDDDDDDGKELFGGSPIRAANYQVDSDVLSLKSARKSRSEELERRRGFNAREEVGSASAARSLGLLARHFLKVSPWYGESDESNWEDALFRHGSVWDEHIYRHEHFIKKTYTSFSACLRQTLESLVVKTRPEDVERDIILPTLHHKVVRLEPSFYDKLTANLFVLFLTANAVTSERTDVDYLFHPKSVKARHRLVNNLRQSNFFWTGFDNKDVDSVIRVGSEYLKKENTSCTTEDRVALERCLDFARMIQQSAAWSEMNNYHELGVFLNEWPKEGMAWTMQTDSNPPMVGVTQLINAQSHVNMRLFHDDPFLGLDTAGQETLAALQEANARKHDKIGNGQIEKIGVPKSGVKNEPLASKYRTTPKKINNRNTKAPDQEDIGNSPKTPSKKSGKRKASETPQLLAVKPISRHEQDSTDLGSDSILRKPSITGTASAKLSYLIDRILELHATEKIIVFYDGENAAFYLAQSLDLLHVKFLIYSRTLSNELRSRYVVTFDADPTIRVLLMDVRCGAYGLNVNKASRVFFINPVCRPSTEAQAMKRAHRIGQTKPVFVETLVLNGTIEAGMFERSRKMTQTEHLEAQQLSDDKGVAEVIQNAKLIPVTLEEGDGDRQMARLKEPVQIFGRKGRGTLMKIKGIDKDEEMDIFGNPKAVGRAAKRRKLNATTGASGDGSLEVVVDGVNGHKIAGVEWMKIPFESTASKGNDVTMEDAANSKSLFG